MVSRLSRALLLALITLDDLSEFGGHCNHGALSTYTLTLVGLYFFFKLLDDLILLAQLKVELAHLILQVGSKIVLCVLLLLIRGSLSLCTVTSILLLLVIFLRNDIVLRLYLLELIDSTVIRLLNEVVC